MLDFEHFISRVYFLSVRGGINANTLLKANIIEAERVFFISNPYSQHDDEQDKKALFHTTFLKNFGVKCKIYLQLSLYDDKYISQLQNDQKNRYIEDKNLLDFEDNNSLVQDNEDDRIEQFGYINKSLHMNSSLKIVKESDLNIIMNPKLSLEAVWFKKLKFTILARNTFCPGLIPFVTWLVTDFPMHIDADEISPSTAVCQEYNSSLNYGVYVCELPFMLESVSFTEAVAKIDHLEYHQLFISNMTRIKLIGLIDIDRNHAMYAPFDTQLEDHYKGIYLWNNSKVKFVINDLNFLTKQETNYFDLGEAMVKLQIMNVKDWCVSHMTLLDKNNYTPKTEHETVKFRKTVKPRIPKNNKLSSNIWIYDIL